MASFQHSYTGNSGNITISVKEQGQTLERFTSVSGNTVYFNALQDGISHIYEVKFSDNNCTISKTFQLTCSPTCIGITGLIITGNSSVNSNATNQPYSISFQGNSPSSIQWTIGGQGTSFTGGSTGTIVYANFGSTGSALLTVSVTDCSGAIKTASTSINQTPTCNLNVTLTSPSCV